MDCAFLGRKAQAWAGDLEELREERERNEDFFLRGREGTIWDRKKDTNGPTERAKAKGKPNKVIQRGWIGGPA